MSLALALFTAYWHFIAAYVGGGVAYAASKWTLTMVKIRRQVLAIVETDAAKIASARKSIVSDVLGNFEYPPQVSNSKAKLFGWTVAWPINLVYTLFADVIKESWIFIYNKCGAILQHIATAILPK